MGKNDTADAPKISLRPVGSLFSDAWKLYKARWRMLVEIVLLPTLVVALGYVLLIVGASIGHWLMVLGGPILFIGYIIFIFSILPIIYSIHNATGVDASYAATIKWFCAFVWVVILEMLALLGGSVLLIIPGIWLGVALTFAVYVFVIEHRRGIDALRQSKDYVKGYWWAVLGRVILLSALFVVISVIIEIIVLILAGDTARVLAMLVMTLFFVPYSMIYHYLIFQNLRERKPELAEAQPAPEKKGTGFIKTAAIVGLIFAVLAVCVLIVAIDSGTFLRLRRTDSFHSSPAYGVHYPLP